jgi:hypothetical protein
MDVLTVNKGKTAEIELDGRSYLRYAIKTHFITVGENLVDIVEQYVSPVYQEGDLLCIAEKIVAICQGNVVYKKDLKVSWLARTLSRYVVKAPHGYGLRDKYAMQIAINLVGPFRIVMAAVAAAFGKLIGKKGWFYQILGPEVRGIDCCLERDSLPNIFPYYFELATLIPEKPDQACQQIKDKLGIACAIVDANDLGVEILGTSQGLDKERQLLARLIKDNPAGQNQQQTPMILVRPRQ